jgi:hypothetical protein
MKKRQQAEQPARTDGWYWLRLFVPLRGGHYNREWEIVRVESGRVQLFGSDCLLPFAAPVLHNALWHGPIEPPPLDNPSTALALQQAGNRQKRTNRSREEPTGFTEAEKTAVKIEVLAEGLVDVFVQSSKDLRAIYQQRHPEWRKEVVDRLAVLLEQAFGGEEE